MLTREAIVSATPALLGRDMDGAVAAVTRYRYHIQEIAQVVSGWLNVGCVTVRKLLRDTQFVTQFFTPLLGQCPVPARCRLAFPRSYS